jgi:hypothetical protein
MQGGLHTRLKAMLWDMPENRKQEIVDKILSDPVESFRNDDQIFIKALNTLQWYELIKLVGAENLLSLLTDSAIQKLFPAKRRTYYINARRLLSKYVISPSGQSA